MPLTKDQMLAALPNLSPDDLKAIRAVIGRLLGEGGVAGHPNDPTGYEPWLREAIQAATGGYVIAHNDKLFNKNAPEAIRFIRKFFEQSLTNKTTALALMRYLLLLLTDNLKDMKVPVTKHTVLQNLHRLEEVFNNNFPGYADEQAAYLIARLAFVDRS